MAIKTYTEQLEEVQGAIANIEANGQSYAIGNRSFTRANLDSLYVREKWLRVMAAREENDNKISVKYVIRS